VTGSSAWWVPPSSTTLREIVFEASRWMRLSLMALLGVLVLAPPAQAIEVGSEGDLFSVEVHGFATQGFILTLDNNYLALDTTHGSFAYSEAGINFTKRLTDKLHVGFQIFAQYLGPTGSYNVKMDWFYLDYRITDWLGFRAGRVKIPFGLYNEIRDVDSARVPVLLPQSVYPIQERNFLLAQTGFELYGYLRLSSLGALDYAAYCGTIFVDTLTPPGSPYQLQSFNVPYVAGGSLFWETPLQGLRLGASIQALRLDATFLFDATSTTVRVPALLWVASLEYVVHDLVVSLEYSRWRQRTDSNNTTIVPETPTNTSERAYAMVTYRLTKWLQPGIYYSLLYPNIEQRNGAANFQKDASATLRFDVNSFWLFKLEGHYMVGTATVDPSLNNNLAPASLSENWAVFLATTTAYF
jgi:hypothetical protein